MEINEVFKLMLDTSINGSLGLFVGSGFAKAVKGQEHNFEPLTWDELLKKCCERLEIDINTIKTSFKSSPSIASEICESIQKSNSITIEEAETRLKMAICQLTAYYPNEKQINKFKPLLKELALKWIITTNYDLLIDSLLDNSYSIGPDNSMVAPEGLIPVYHIHGIRTEPNSIVINNKDYCLMGRPHEYRMDTLAMKIKESTTIMIGYSISDTNVLSAIDIANNVYTSKSTIFQDKIIQIIYDENVTTGYYIEPDSNSTIIRVWCDKIERFLSDYKDFKEEDTKNFKAIENKNRNFLDSIEKLDQNAIDTVIKPFINNFNYRSSIINWYNSFGYRYIREFLRLITRAFELCWENCCKPGNFDSYRDIVILIIDLLHNIDTRYFHPSLYSIIISNFQSVSGMVGYGFGESWSSMDYWNKNKDNIPKKTLKELYVISKQSIYWTLTDLLKKSFPEIDNDIKI